MGLWRFIKRLKPRQLWKLCLLCTANLTKVWPTWKATKNSVAYATEIYGKSHQKNNQANAFRHALWSYLIAMYCLRKPEQKEDTLQWAIKITDMHEYLFPNKPLAREMDIHNNHLGIHYFKLHGELDEVEIINILKELTGESILISELEELEQIPKDKMVHLVNMNTL